MGSVISLEYIALPELHRDINLNILNHRANFIMNKNHTPKQVPTFGLEASCLHKVDSLEHLG